MTFSDSFLSNAGWLFFTAWSVVIAALCVTAFGRDLLAWKSLLEPAPKSQNPAEVRPTQSSAL
jgi:hypothetical protein